MYKSLYDERHLYLAFIVPLVCERNSPHSFYSYEGSIKGKIKGLSTLYKRAVKDTP